MGKRTEDSLVVPQDDRQRRAHRVTNRGHGWAFGARPGNRHRRHRERLVARPPQAQEVNCHAVRVGEWPDMAAGDLAPVHGDLSHLDPEAPGHEQEIHVDANPSTCE